METICRNKQWNGFTLEAEEYRPTIVTESPTKFGFRRSALLHNPTLQTLQGMKGDWARRVVEGGDPFPFQNYVYVVRKGKKGIRVIGYKI